jgi:hypothetical protein
MGAMVSQITGWSSVRIAQDDVIWKPPFQQKTMIGFHQDGAYISDQFVPRDNNSVTVWMALDDATEDMGCLEYAVGSHLWKEQVSASSDAIVFSFHPLLAHYGRCATLFSCRLLQWTNLPFMAAMLRLIEIRYHMMLKFV